MSIESFRFIHLNFLYRWVDVIEIASLDCSMLMVYCFHDVCFEKDNRKLIIDKPCILYTEQIIVSPANINPITNEKF